MSQMDSLGQVDAFMGAPPLSQKGGKGGGDGGNFFQGIFKALGIGNKNIDGTASQVEPMQKVSDDLVNQPTLGETPSAMMSKDEALGVVIPEVAASQQAAASTTDMLKALFAGG